MKRITETIPRVMITLATMGLLAAACSSETTAPAVETSETTETSIAATTEQQVVPVDFADEPTFAIETTMEFGEDEAVGTFEVTTGPDDLGCLSGSVVETAGPSGISNEFTCQDGPREGTFTIEWQIIAGSDGPGEWNGPWKLTDSTGDFVGLTGEGLWSGNSGEGTSGFGSFLTETLSAELLADLARTEQKESILDEEFLAATASETPVSDGAFLFAVVDKNGDAIEGANGVDANGIRPTAGDSFRIGSITKVFTSLATLTLIEDGDVDLDAPASTYVSRVAVPEEVTVRDLLQHTSGIYNITDLPGFFDDLFAEPGHVWSPEEQLALIADQPSLFEPGSEFRYSNSNYIILGVLIEEVTGQPYHEVVRERISGPLDLDSTYVDGFEDGPALFDPFDPEGDVDYDYTSIATVAWSAGGMVSSAQDLHTLFTALFDEQIVSANMIDMMTEDSQYGFGVVLGEWGQGLIGHSGGIPGYSTMVRHSPATGVTAFLASTDEQANYGYAINRMFKAFATDQPD